MPWLASVVFVLSFALAVYTLFGYPLLLAALSRLIARPVTTRAGRKTVSVILPVRDGEFWITQKLESILALDYPRELMEIFVVSDGSIDGTEAAVQRFAPQGVQLIRIPRGGKAVALNAAMERCRGEILFFTDVRQQLERDSLRTLVSYFADPQVGVVSGELVISAGSSHEEANSSLYWRYEKWIRSNLSRIDSVIGATGCIYCMRRELAAPLPPDTLADDLYLPLTAFLRGYRIVLSTAKAFDHPTNLNTEFRRKVRTLAGVYQVIGRWPVLLGPSNRMWVHFISHKFARLLLPYAALAMAVSAFWLPAPFAGAAVLAQAVFYGLALLDTVLPEGFAGKRLTSVMRTFVVLIAAALFAISVYFVPSRFFWSAPTKPQVNARAASS